VLIHASYIKAGLSYEQYTHVLNPVLTYKNGALGVQYHKRNSSGVLKCPNIDCLRRRQSTNVFIVTMETTTILFLSNLLRIHYSVVIISSRFNHDAYLDETRIKVYLSLLFSLNKPRTITS